MAALDEWTVNQFSPYLMVQWVWVSNLNKEGVILFLWQVTRRGYEMECDH